MDNSQKPGKDQEQKKTDETKPAAKKPAAKQGKPLGRSDFRLACIVYCLTEIRDSGSVSISQLADEMNCSHGSASLVLSLMHRARLVRRYQEVNSKKVPVFVYRAGTHVIFH